MRYLLFSRKEVENVQFSELKPEIRIRTRQRTRIKKEWRLIQGGKFQE